MGVVRMNNVSGRWFSKQAAEAKSEIIEVDGRPTGMGKWLRYLLVALVCAAMGVGAFAQTPTGSIDGTVLDPSGLPVEGASVTLTNVGTNYTYTTATGGAGAYQFSRIDAAVYRVTVSADGFRAAVVDNIKLDAATIYSVPPIKLEVGGKTETITVEAGAEVVNTTDTEVSSTVEKKQIDDLPILNRNPVALLGLEAGVNQNNSQSTTIDGQRSTYSNLTMDGINIQDNFIREGVLDYTPNLPFNSQAQEFTVINQNAGVEYGNGASQVAIVTPKGTNQIHGEGFWYYRTNAWAANNWFNDASGVPLGKLIQNQGGGNLGGPVIKNKLFVYGWYELLRTKANQPNETTVLSPTILAALSSPNPTLPFTYTPTDANGNPDQGGPVTVNLLTVQNGNPLRGPKPFPLTSATTFTTDPTMLALIAQIPNCSVVAGCNNRVGDGVNLLGYQFNQRANQTQDNYGFRVDYDLNTHNTISGTWAWNRQIVDRPNAPNGGDPSFNVIPAVTNNYSTKFLSLAWRWSPGGTITNEARFGFNLQPAYFYTTQQFGSYILDDTTLPFTDPNPNFLPQGRDTHTWTALDNASFTKGNHVIKFGGMVYRTTVFTTGTDQYTTYALGFSGGNPQGFDPSDFPTTNSNVYSIGNSDFGNANSILTSAAGILSTVSQTFNSTSQTSGYQSVPQDRNYRQNQFAIYAGDSWRISPRLTVNYGLRWDYYGPVGEKNGLVLLPEIPQGQNINNVLLGNATVNFAGGNSPTGLYRGYWKSFAPNIGLAWDPFGDGKTAVRAGFSINYVNDEYFTAADNAAAGNTGLSATPANINLFGPTVTNPLGANVVTPPPFQIPIDFQTSAWNSTSGLGALAGYGIDPNIKPPSVQQWNLSVQRDIGWNTSVQVSYVGNHGVGLFRAIDVNQLNLNAMAVCANVTTPCPTDTFLQEFNQARAYGFASQAEGNGFLPTSGCPAAHGFPAGVTSPYCLPIFYNLFGGAIDPGQFVFPSFVTLVQQGQVGSLIGTYHADQFDTGCCLPGQFNTINWFQNPYIMGGDLLKNTSFSNYNAGIVEVRRRFSRGLYFQANYTFSKVMTDFAGSQSQFQPFLDNARPYLERQRAQFDITQAFKANFTYELPIGRGHKMFGSPSRVVGLLVNGWQMGSVFTWQTGAPYSILSGYGTFNRAGLRSFYNTAESTLTHQQISGDLGVFKTTTGQVYLLNPKLISSDGTGIGQIGLTCAPAVQGGFCNPQPGELGNLQENAFSGPAYFDWDMSAAKDFDLSERFKLTFRTEAFNLTNHPVFAPPLDSNGTASFNINNTNFGQSTNTISTARILQMSLRLKF
jgi:Carboxypeptidase regulatory-like domain/TonB dependent receptor